jgi:hypothetical protein
MRTFLLYSTLAAVILGFAAIPFRLQSQVQDAPSIRASNRDLSDPLSGPGANYLEVPLDKAQRQLAQADHELSRKSEQLAAQYGGAKEDDKKSQLRTELRETLEKQFQLQEKRREQELVKIEERLKSLRELMQKRKDARQAIIDRRLDQLLRDAEGLGWNAPTTGGSSSSRAPSAVVYPSPQTVRTRVSR